MTATESKWGDSTVAPIHLVRLTLMLEARLKELARSLRNRENTSVEGTDVPDDIEPLLHVKAALDRIAAGTYGSCLQCDEPIGIKRLAVLPHAAFCIPCQEDMEPGENHESGQSGIGGMTSEFDFLKEVRNNV